MNPIPVRRLAVALADWVLLAMGALIACLCAAFDVLVLGDGIPEVSLTELLQVVLLLGFVVLLLARAVRRPRERGFLALFAGFCACMFVRELDGFLDSIRHGFWLWPALAAATGSAAYALTAGRDSIWEPMADFLESKAGFLTGMGLVLLLVFSRVFGSSILWRDFMASELRGPFKSALQEGLEMLGYVYLAGGVFLHARRIPPAPAPDSGG